MGGSGGNSMVCVPGSQMPCYEGEPKTEGTGECHGGMATCFGDGSGYGPCDGQVVNAVVDDCKTPLFDENCDGIENDNCPGEHVAIVAAAPPGYADDVRNYLMATGKFAAVNIYDASVTTPTLVQLQIHQSVLVFSDKVFIDPIGLGDVLADYYDDGGRVVVAMYSSIGTGTRIQGRFGDPKNGYMIMDPVATLDGPTDDGLGTVQEPQSRLLRNVSQFSYEASMKSSGSLANGGTAVAQWSNGLPLIVRGTVQGRNRVDVNFYPPQVQMAVMRWAGDGATILSNALLF